LFIRKYAHYALRYDITMQIYVERATPEAERYVSLLLGLLHRTTVRHGALMVVAAVAAAAADGARQLSASNGLRSAVPHVQIAGATLLPVNFQLMTDGHHFGASADGADYTGSERTNADAPSNATRLTRSM